MEFLTPFFGRLERQNLNMKLTPGLTISFLDVLGSARAFVDSPALFRSLSVAHLCLGSITFSHNLFGRLLLESDLTKFLKIFLANLLLGRLELRDVSVVAFLDVFVLALQQGVLGQALNFRVLDYTQSTISSAFGFAEIDSTRNSGCISRTGSSLRRTARKARATLIGASRKSRSFL